MAAALARRFTRPLVGGGGGHPPDRLRGPRRHRAGQPRHEDPEFAQLAESINAMGANLVRARDQERQFLLSVSHELRTPLTSIRGYADAVIDGATDDPAGAAPVISAEARRLERLVQDLLDLARLDADRFSLDSDRGRAEVVETGGRRLPAPGPAELGLELAARPAECPVWVEADSDRLGQVVANLIENASSFAGTSEVGPVGVGTPGRPVAWVADDGPGIPADQLARSSSATSSPTG